MPNFFSQANKQTKPKRNPQSFSVANSTPGITCESCGMRISCPIAPKAAWEYKPPANPGFFCPYGIH